MTSSLSDVFVLFEGFSKVDPNQSIMKANCTSTLIKSKGKNIIIDTMTPWDKDKLIGELACHQVDPGQVNFLICTHGHSDHIGNNNLFLNATHIVGQSVSKGEEYDLKAFEQGKYVVTEDVEIFPTPGHTLDSISVKVRTEKGLVVVAGDLFEREEDLKDDTIWREIAGSEDETKQEYHRKEVLNIADYVIPGHGPMFRVLKE